MDACSISSPILGCFYTMVAVAVVVNVAHILSVKPPKKVANSTDVLQWFRTGVVLFVLVFVLPLQTTPFTEDAGGGFSGVTLASLSNQLLVDVYPLGLLATAVTRLRVCLCRGNADVLVTKTSAILTLSAFFTPLLISVTVMSLSTHCEHPLIQHCLNTTLSTNQSRAPWYSLFITVIFDIIPIVLTFVMYGLIHWRYLKSENNAQRRNLNAGRQRKMTIVQLTGRNGRSICRSVFLLVLTVMLTWVPYVAFKLGFRLETFYFDKDSEHAVCLFIILTLYLASPVAEGLFLKQKRENLSEFAKQVGVAIRSRFAVTPAADELDQHAISRPAPSVFFIQPGTTATNPVMLHASGMGTEHICIKSDTAPVTSQPRNSSKRRRVCFSSELEYDDLVSLRRVSTFSRKSRMKTRRRRKMSDRRLRKMTGSSVATLYKSDTQTDEQTDECSTVIELDRQKSSGYCLRCGNRGRNMEGEMFKPEVTECSCFQGNGNATEQCSEPTHGFLSPIVTTHRRDKHSPILPRFQRDLLEGGVLSPKSRRDESRQLSPSYSSDVFTFDEAPSGHPFRPTSAAPFQQAPEPQSTNVFVSMPEQPSTNVIVQTQQDAQSANVYVQSPDVTARNIHVHVDFGGSKVESKVNVSKNETRVVLKPDHADQKETRVDQKEA